MRIFWRALVRTLRSRRGEAELAAQATEAILWLVMSVVIVGSLWFIGRAAGEMKGHIASNSSGSTLIDRMVEECRGVALSCRVPANDIFGASNADGHEVGFFARTECAPSNPCGPLGKGEDLFWFYYWNKSAQTVQEYTEQWNGTAYTSPVAKGAPYTGVTNFVAANVLASARANSGSGYYNPVVAKITGLSDVNCSYGFTDFPGWNGTVDLLIEFGTNGKDGIFPASLGQDQIYCMPGRTYITAFYQGPSPTPAPIPAASWPEVLTLGVSGASVGTTSGASPVALTNDPAVAFAPVLNALLGGGVARAAAAAQPCFALAKTTSGSVDTSLPASISSAIGVYVDSNGCEVDANDDPLPAAPPNGGGLSATMVAYNTQGVSETYSIQSANSTCSSSGIAATFPWYPANASGVGVSLEAQGSKAGSCSVVLTNGQTTQTPAPDAGLITVDVVVNIPCTLDAYGYCSVPGTAVAGGIKIVSPGCEVPNGTVVGTGSGTAPNGYTYDGIVIGQAPYTVYKSGVGPVGTYYRDSMMYNVTCTTGGGYSGVLSGWSTENAEDRSNVPISGASDPATVYADPNLP